MAYELETIETKITENIFLAASESISVDVPEFLRDLDSECAKVKRAFKQQVVSFESDNLVKRYFHFHQESLIDLINNIHATAAASDTIDLVEPVVTRLFTLLGYLEEHFPEYFDLDMKMPVAAMHQIKQEVNSLTESISAQFKNTKIDIGLVALIRNAIEQFSSQGMSISFRSFYYLRYLRVSLANIKLDIESETIDVIRILMHCNFNADSFYAYFVRYIQWSIQKVSSVNEKLDELAFYIKFANQETCASNLAFNHFNQPINIQIAEWISQEAQYLKHKQQSVPFSVNAEDAVPTDYKLNFDLSVPLLAYLFRAFIETGVIQNKNTSELIRFLAKYAKTKRSESISYESLRIKYYSVENGTKDAVKKMLQSVVNFISKD